MSHTRIDGVHDQQICLQCQEETAAMAAADDARRVSIQAERERELEAFYAGTPGYSGISIEDARRWAFREEAGAFGKSWKVVNKDEITSEGAYDPIFT
jgi:hypothetical protein